MRWKKISNTIVASILSLIYLINTILYIVSPMHMNAAGGMNSPGLQILYSFLYLFIALFLTWTAYLILNKKPEFLFFILIILGVILIFFPTFIF